tara:strand:- start:7 stop:546 length:540 start_codon:yes stop_codon:yes gene_type:complete
MSVVILLCVNATYSQAETDEKVPIIFNVLVIDVNKLVGLSDIGRTVQVQYEQAKSALDNEFEGLKTELIAEELRLSEIRKTTNVAEFRQLARDFDQRTTEVRDSYIERKNNIENVLNVNRRKIFEASVPYLKQILNQNNATVLIRKDQTVLSANGVDITDLAINTINANLDTNLFLADK